MAAHSAGEPGKAQGGAKERLRQEGDGEGFPLPGQREIVTPIGGVVPPPGAYAISSADTALPTPPPALGPTGTVPDSKRQKGAPADPHSQTTMAMGPPPKELTPPEEILPTGTLVHGRYEIGAPLGRGGMGAVYKARDKVLDEEVAIKILLPAVVSAPGMAERFLIEAKTALALTHPGIVRVRSFEQDPERRSAYIVMALVRGRSLRGLLRERGRFEGKDALDLVARVLDALVVAHKVTIHRDLKPENIMVEESGQPVILDFGLAKAVPRGGRDGITRSGAVMGTFAYMAPEQGLDSSQVDGRADVYAMGAILYELWTGQLPQGAFPPPSKVRQDLPPGADEVVLKALSYVLEGRYQSAQEFLDAVNGLRALYGGVPGAGSGPTFPGASAGTPNPTGKGNVPTPKEEHPTAPWWTGGREPPGRDARAQDTVDEPPREGRRTPLRPEIVTPQPLGYVQPFLVVVALVAIILVAADFLSRRSGGAPPSGSSGSPGAASTAASASFAAPAAKLPARIAEPPPVAPPAHQPGPTTREHFALEGERAWRDFLASARPFEAFPTQALLEAWPALEGKHALVHVHDLEQNLDYTDADGVRFSLKEVPGGGRIMARWAGFIEKEEWFRNEIGFYEGVDQDVVGELVGVVRRRQKINDEEVLRDWPVIEVRWKWARGHCAYVPGPGGTGTALAGEDAYQAALRARWSDPKLLAKPSGRQVAEAALRAAREGNRPLFETLWAKRRESRRRMETMWSGLRACFRTTGPHDRPDSIIRDWVVSDEALFRNFRGEPEGRVHIVYTSEAGEQGYRTDDWDLVQEGGVWRLGSLEDFVPLPRSGLAPPPADAPPEEVYALFLRAAMEDDQDLARKLVLPGKADVAALWLQDWQRELARGMTEAPVGEKNQGESADVLEIVSAPKNGRPGGESWPRRMGLRRVNGVWKVEQGYQQ